MAIMGVAVPNRGCLMPKTDLPRRVWREDALLAMAAYVACDLLLLVAVFALEATQVRSETTISVNGLWQWAFEAWLVWRVLRNRGAVSCALLRLGAALMAVLGILASPVGALPVMLGVATVAQLALLYSPAVRRHMSGGPLPPRAHGWARALQRSLLEVAPAGRPAAPASV
jgi:hypothetical protein